jgi:pyridoxamine 5'-phosphate oxidase
MNASAATLNAAGNPIELLVKWLSEAKALDGDNYNAMALATADSTGFPNVRIMLLKEVDERGLSFFSNEESDKGREIAANPRSAFALHLRPLRRQIRGRGYVERLSPQDSDLYFATRPRESQISAWVSAQSRPIPDRFKLDDNFKIIAERYSGEPVPRPPYWVGYRLSPLVLEFWSERPHRLHERLCYSRERIDDGWKATFLYP